MYAASRWPLVCLLATCACSGGDDDGDGADAGDGAGDGGGQEVSWQLLREQEPAALLSVWGTSANDVWVVGGRTQSTGPVLLHLDDSGWERLDAGRPDIDLWIVFGFEGGDVYFGGSDGAILRHRDGAVETVTTPPGGTLFGLWGSSPEDMWAVGDDGAGGGIVWHLEGGEWVDVPLPEGVTGQVFKVHGQAADDVWFACAGGVTLHWDGAQLERVETGTTSPLFSIVTTPDTAIAVGGVDGQGEILENAGAGWEIRDATVPVPWRGTAAAGETAVAVGEQGAVAERTADGWTVSSQTLVELDFHAAWVDPDGGLWGVGGIFDAAVATSEGFLLYRGREAAIEVVP
jgi:hypothetical protein